MAATAPATGSGDSGRSPDKATAGQQQGKEQPHTTVQQQPRQKKKGLAARAQEMAQAAWQVSKIFSPPVKQPLLRVLALWLVAHRIILTFLVTLVVRVVYVYELIGEGAVVCCRIAPPPSAYTNTPPYQPHHKHNTHHPMHQLSYVAQAIPALKPAFISFIVGALVPKDPFSRPFVDIILEGSRP